MKWSAYRSVVFLVLLSHIAQLSALQTPKPIIKEGRINVQPPSPLQVIGIYAVAPALPALVLPILTEAYRSSQDPSALLTVLIAKRGFIYFLAILSTTYAGWRASTSLPAGESLDALNREILLGESPPDSDANATLEGTQIEQTKEVEEKDTDAISVFALLDENKDVGQNVAIALPFVLAAALAISFLLLQGPVPSATVDTNNIDLLAIFGGFSTISNLAVCLLFSATEYRSSTAPPDDGSRPKFPANIFSVPNIIALVAVTAASLLPLSEAWPFQNSINIAIAVTVTRALAPFIIGDSGSIRTVALALTGLAAYDVFSVFGTSLLAVQAAGAIDINSITSSATDMMTHVGSSTGNTGLEATSIITAGDSSVMETVARAKLQGPWRPGLLEMVLVGRVSDVLGLGDIVFPACLVSWGFTLDMAYAYAAVGGYVLGSVLTEVVGTLGPEWAGQGLPALVFITPAMLGCVSILAIQRGEMERIWGNNDDKNSDNTGQNHS